MFGFFRNKKEVAISDQIWQSQHAKWEACAKMATTNNRCTFIAWFPHTKDVLSAFLAARDVSANVILASEINSLKDDEITIFVEHHPLADKEQELFLKLNLHHVPVLSSLDEPLFSLFGGENTIRLMKKMGMHEGEIVSHPMISKSIRNAQRKIARKVTAEIKTDSQEEWLKKNVK